MEDKFTAPSFAGFDNGGLMADLGDFLTRVIRRHPNDLVTHLFIGNETDLFLRPHPQYQSGFLTLMDHLNIMASQIPNRAKFGTIFTFVPDSLSPNFNAMARSLAPRVERTAFTIYPYLASAELDERLDPTEEVISTWFDSAAEVVGGRDFVVTETSHSASGPIGTVDDQTRFTQNLHSYLETTGARIDFVTWWAIEDSDTHPDEEFRHTGLLTNQGAKRPSYDLWTRASR